VINSGTIAVLNLKFEVCQRRRAGDFEVLLLGPDKCN